MTKNEQSYLIELAHQFNINASATLKKDDVDEQLYYAVKFDGFITTLADRAFIFIREF